MFADEFPIVNVYEMLSRRDLLSEEPTGCGRCGVPPFSRFMHTLIFPGL